MPLLPGFQYEDMPYFSKTILRRSRRNCLFVMRFDACPVNAAHADGRSNDSASGDPACEQHYPNTKERANLLFCRPE